MAGAQAVGVKLTLVTTNTTYNLYDLLEAEEAQASPNVSELHVKADDGNSGDVLIGDLDVAASRFGRKLDAGDSLLLQAPAANSISLRGMEVRPVGNSQVLHVLTTVI